jgi:hypothetical protein
MGFGDGDEPTFQKTGRGCHYPAGLIYFHGPDNATTLWTVPAKSADGLLAKRNGETSLPTSRRLVVRYCRDECQAVSSGLIEFHE